MTKEQLGQCAMILLAPTALIAGCPGGGSGGGTLISVGGVKVTMGSVEISGGGTSVSAQGVKVEPPPGCRIQDVSIVIYGEKDGDGTPDPEEPIWRTFSISNNPEEGPVSVGDVSFTVGMFDGQPSIHLEGTICCDDPCDPIPFEGSTTIDSNSNFAPVVSDTNNNPPLNIGEDPESEQKQIGIKAMRP